MSYAWIIDRDHLDESPEYSDNDGGCVGVMGPSYAPDWMTEMLSSGRKTGKVMNLEDPNRETRIYTFRMWDDDGILYVTGRMITDEGQSEDACYGPLRDYGAPGMGAVRVGYIGHPEMEVS